MKVLKQQTNQQRKNGTGITLRFEIYVGIVI